MKNEKWEGQFAIFEIYFSQLFERIKVDVAPFWKPHAKVFLARAPDSRNAYGAAGGSGAASSFGEHAS